MKSIEQWIEEYGKSHQNSTNKAIHWICVPLIMLSLLALISMIPFPINDITLFSINGEKVLLNWTIIFLLFAIIFYLRLSISIAVGMLLIAIGMIASINWIELFDSTIWRLSLSIFVMAWIGQFIGH